MPFYHDGQGVVDIDKSENAFTDHVQGVVQPQYPAMTSCQGVVSFDHVVRAPYMKGLYIKGPGPGESPSFPVVVVWQCQSLLLSTQLEM